MKDNSSYILTLIFAYALTIACFCICIIQGIEINKLKIRLDNAEFNLSSANDRLKSIDKKLVYVPRITNEGGD